MAVMNAKPSLRVDRLFPPSESPTDVEQIGLARHDIHGTVDVLKFGPVVFLVGVLSRVLVDEGSDIIGFAASQSCNVTSKHAIGKPWVWYASSSD